MFYEYEEKLEEYMQLYILEYGQRKFSKIAEKLLTSNSVKNFLSNPYYYTRAILNTDIINTVLNIPYFGFGKKSTVEMAALMLLQTWNEQINKNLLLLKDNELCTLFDSITKKCRGMI